MLSSDVKERITLDQAISDLSKLNASKSYVQTLIAYEHKNEMYK